MTSNIYYFISDTKPEVKRKLKEEQEKICLTTPPSPDSFDEKKLNAANQEDTGCGSRDKSDENETDHSAKKHHNTFVKLDDETPKNHMMLDTPNSPRLMRFGMVNKKVDFNM